MQKKCLLILLVLTVFSFSNFAQNRDGDYYGLDDDEDSSSSFFIGFNVGGHFANKNTALLYTGAPNVTPFGIQHIFNQQQNQQVFRDYFRFPYQIAEYPFDPVYRPTIEIGVHLGFDISQSIAIFLDLNSAQLDYEQFFTVAIDDPNNQSTEPTFEQLPVIGEEDRFNLNLGVQLNYFEDNGTKAYFSLFGNLNGVEMQRNFIVVNNIDYEIFHFVGNNPNQRPGGIGYGGGG